MDEDTFPLRGFVRGLGRLVLIGVTAGVIVVTAVGVAAFVVVKNI